MTPMVNACPARVSVVMRICGPSHAMITTTAMSVPLQVIQKLVRRRARNPSVLKTSNMTSAWNAT
ncbi:hypothetical protein D3C71_1813720 [compost metagenome]